jgi:hypothetical protein
MSQEVTPAPSKLKIKHGLAIHAFTLSLIDSVVEEVRKLTEFHSKCLDPELTKSVMKMVRDAIIESQGNQLTSKQAGKLDKVELTVSALCKCFGLSEDEEALIRGQIQFLIDNKVVSKRVFTSVVRRVGNGLLESTEVLEGSMDGWVMSTLSTFVVTYFGCTNGGNSRSDRSVNTLRRTS